MTEFIAKPMGLAKAGPSGAGGQFEPLKRIRKDIFDRVGIAYCLKFNEDAGFQPTKDTCLIDIIYDGYTQSDPHSSRPMVFVTGFANNSQKSGWFGWFKSPNNHARFGAIGKHAVTIKCAPRKTPTGWGAAAQNAEVAPRDFSETAGGISKTFEFEIYPETDPMDPDPAADQYAK